MGLAVELSEDVPSAEREGEALVEGLVENEAVASIVALMVVDRELLVVTDAVNVRVSVGSALELWPVGEAETVVVWDAVNSNDNDFVKEKERELSMEKVVLFDALSSSVSDLESDNVSLDVSVAERSLDALDEGRTVSE
jgi:hypothetical protein